MKRIVLSLVAAVAMVVVGCSNDASLDPVSSTPAVVSPVSGGGPITVKTGRFEFSSGWPDGWELDGCRVPLEIKGVSNYSLTSTSVHGKYQVSATAKLFTRDGRTIGKVKGTVQSQTTLSNGSAYIRPSYEIIGRPDLRLVLLCVIADGDINFKSLYLERNDHWAVTGN